MNEKVTDGARSMFEKATGKNIPDKVRRMLFIDKRLFVDAPSWLSKWQSIGVYGQDKIQFWSKTDEEEMDLKDDKCC